MYYIYGHFNPQNNECFYIGKGGGSKKENGSNYYRANTFYGRNSYHSHYINKYGVKVKILCDNIQDEGDIYKKEKEFIEKFNPKCNMSIGGVGGRTGVKHSEDYKKHKSESMKGKKNPMYSKKHREKSKMKMRKAKLGKKQSYNHIEKCRKKRYGNKNALGFKHSEEHKKKIRKLHKNGSMFSLKVICLDTNEVFESIAKMCRKYGLDPSCVTKVCKGKAKTHKKMRFKYYV